MGLQMSHFLFAKYFFKIMLDKDFVRCYIVYNRRQIIMNYIDLPEKHEIDLFGRLADSITTDFFLKNGDEFYNKVKLEYHNSDDFYNPQYSPDRLHPTLAKTASHRVDQVRAGDVSVGAAIDRLLVSLETRGITRYIVAYLDFGQNKRHKCVVVDGATRIAGQKTLKGKDETHNDVVPVANIVDRYLSDLVKKYQKYFSNLVNDHLPDEASSSQDIKQFLKTIDPESINNNRENIIGIVLRMCGNNRARSTVNNWLSEIVNNQKATGNNIKRYNTKVDRHTAIKANISEDIIPSGAWLSAPGEEGLLTNNSKKKIFSRDPSQGNLSKSIGDAMLYKADHPDGEFVSIWHSKATSKGGVGEAINGIFEKISKLPYNPFDHIMILGQEIGTNEDKVMTRAEWDPAWANQQKAQEEHENELTEATESKVLPFNKSGV